MQYKTAEEAVSCIASGNRVFIHTAAAMPKRLVQAMVNRAPELRNVEIVHLHTEGPADYTDEKYAASFITKVFFVAGNTRKAVSEGRVSYIPMFLSEIPALFRKGIMPLDVALVQVSPPDQHGFCSLGISVDVSNAAIDSAKFVVAQVNPNMPRTFGDGTVHISKIHAWIECDDALPEVHIPPATETDMQIGKNVAALVEDGATLQMGIGAIPNATLACLNNHKNLGIHTEMFSDGIIPLVKSGVINGTKKTKFHEKIVSGFAMGTKTLYDFMHDNPMILMLDVGYVNDTTNIRRNQKVTAINSALEVDIFGQVCADTIGSKQYSGVGGQMDFIRGAALSEGGKPIIALPSATSSGISRIVSTLKKGAGITTTRAHVHYIVTEYGSAYLYGKTLLERAKLLISIAHPDHREQLEREAHDILKSL